MIRFETFYPPQKISRIQLTLLSSIWTGIPGIIPIQIHFINILPSFYVISPVFYTLYIHSAKSGSTFYVHQLKKWYTPDEKLLLTPVKTPTGNVLDTITSLTVITQSITFRKMFEKIGMLLTMLLPKKVNVRIYVLWIIYNLCKKFRYVWRTRISKKIRISKGTIQTKITSITTIIRTTTIVKFSMYADNGYGLPSITLFLET